MKWFFKKLGGHFLAGLMVIVPLGITLLILYWLFSWIDELLQPAIVAIWGHRVPGVGFGVIIVLIYVVGLLVSNLLGKRILNYIENYVLHKIPVIGFFYRGIKQVMESFSKKSKNGFLRVVFVEFPRKGSQAVGFITNEEDKNGEKQFNVFVPTSPNPTTGFLLIVKEEEIIPTKMSVDEAFKLIISAGKYSPQVKETKEKPAKE